MSFMHLPSANNSSSSTSTSYSQMKSTGGISTVSSSSSLASSSSSLLGSIGAGKQTTIGQPPSTSSLTHQLFLKQPHLLNGQLQSSHIESIFSSAINSSSQSQMEKNVNIFVSPTMKRTKPFYFQFELQQEDFPPLPHRSNSHDSNSSTNNIQTSYQNQYSSSSNHPTMTNGYNGSQPHPQSQSPVSFKSSIETLSTLISRHQKTSNSTNNNNSANSSSQSITNNNGLPSSTITDQYGLAGLLSLIQQAEKSPDSSMLLNFDLTTLGLSKFNDLFEFR